MRHVMAHQSERGLQSNAVAIHHLTCCGLTSKAGFDTHQEPSEVEAMDLRRHELISERLDGLKTRGIVSEYLVAWRGHSGHLEPNVTVWNNDVLSDQQLTKELESLLAEMVCPAAVTVHADAR
jgi:hypothetical protein